MDTTAIADPLSKSFELWRSELGQLKRRGLPEDDPQVRQCREAMAYWRVRRSVEEARSELSAAGVDLLVAQLLGVSR